MQFKFTNQLIGETSAYLLQHAHNPVNWFPWSDNTFQKAKDENKLLMISIGYSSCHWCHVMERESFENNEIADILNENFVCIKVDREERPDIDQVYMLFVQMMTGQGGWPLTCFVLPDGRPVYGGTYFFPERFVGLLKKLANDFKMQPNYLTEVADEVIGRVKYYENDKVKIETKHFDLDEIHSAYKKWSVFFDLKFGGDKRVPKFPMPLNYQFLLKYYYYTKDINVFDHLMRTLENIANGGIYDHLGGGFARYSTDEKWIVPHFEKMLYDNALLISLYSDAYKLTKKELFKNTIIETLDFISREMTSPDGGFYSSFDADSEGEEGKYYVWNKNEIDRLLGQNSKVFCEYFGVTETGNFNEKNILNKKKLLSKIAIENMVSEEAVFQIISVSKRVLFEEREKRIKPALDKKIITSWNAMMLKGFTDAYIATGDYRFLEWAIVNAEFIEQNLLNSDGSLYHIFSNDTSKIEGFLDDYSFSASAFIRLYQASFDDKWAFLAKKIADYAINNFFNNETGMFFYTSAKSEKLLIRETEIFDNVIPSSNSEMAHVLMDLSKLFFDESYSITAKKMLNNVRSQLLENLSFYSNWGSLYIDLLYPKTDVTITGRSGIETALELSNNFIPDVFFTGTLGKSKLPVVENRFFENDTKIYVCKNNVCFPEVNTIDEAMHLIAN